MIATCEVELVLAQASGCSHFGTGQVGPGQVRSCQIGSPKIGPNSRDSLQIGALEIGSGKPGSKQVGDGKIGVRKVGLIHGGQAQISLTQARPGNIDPWQIAIAQIGLKQVAARTGLARLDAGNLRGVLSLSRA